MSFILYNAAYQETVEYRSPEVLFESNILSSHPSDLFIVVPTGRYVRELTLNLTRLYYIRTAKPCPKLNIYTLQDFIQYCFHTLGVKEKYRLISDAYRLALMEEAINTASPSFYNSKDLNLSYSLISKLSALILGLKEDGIKVGDMESELVSSDTNKEIFNPQRLKDIIGIYKAYNDILGELLFDPPGIVEVINEYLQNEDLNKEPFIIEPSYQLKDSPLNNLFCGSSVHFYGFSEFKQPEIRFLEFFARVNFKVIINLDFSRLNGPLFGNLDETVNKLEIAGYTGKECIEVNESGFHKQSTSDYLRRWLFNTESNIKDLRLKGIVRIYESNTRYDEAKSISKLVKDLIIREDYSPGEICIVSRQPEKYSDFFRELFYEYEIPVNISDRYNLSASPVIVSIFAYLDIISRNFKLKDIIKVLQSPYFDFSEEVEKRELDVSNLNSVCQSLRLTGGRYIGIDFWLERLKSYLDFYLRNIDQLKTDDADPEEINELESKAESVKKAYEDFSYFAHYLTNLKSKLTPNDFNDFIMTHIIEKLRIERCIEHHRQRIVEISSNTSKNRITYYNDEIEKDFRALSEFKKLLDEMCFIMDERYPERLFRLDELISKLRLATSGAKYQIREKKNLGVTVTSIEQTRGISYKVMILCGALDKEFPLAYRAETLIGKDLQPSEKRHIQSERLQFFQFLSNSPEFLDNREKRIFIFYPKSDDSEELIRSPFIDDLLKVVELEEGTDIFSIKGKVISSDNPSGLEQTINENSWLNSIASLSELSEIFSSLDKTLINNLPADTITKLNNQINTFTFEADNGKINLNRLSEPEKLWLEERRTSPISVSDLDLFARCSYKYFVKKVLKLEEEEEAELTLSSLEKGILLHQILYKFYTDIQKEQFIEHGAGIIAKSKVKGLPDIFPVIINKSDYLYYKEKLFKIANEIIVRNRYDNPLFEVDLKDILGDRDRLGILERWLNFELESDRDRNFCPSLFELAFGLPKRKTGKSTIEPVDLGQGLKIRGKIDRVEINASNEKEIDFIVADYKLNKGAQIPGDSAIKKKKHFQMPLYLLVMEKILRDYYNIEAHKKSAIYYFLNVKMNSGTLRGREDLTEVLSAERDTGNEAENADSPLKVRETLLNEIVDEAVRILESVSFGDFSDKSGNSSECDKCTFITICRNNDRL